MRDQTAAWPKQPFYLLVAHAPSILLLRPLEARVERPPVTRLRAERDAAPSWVEPEDAHAALDALVARALDDGLTTLGAVSARVLPELPAPLHYAATGRVADAVARRARVHADHERPWVAVSEQLEVEDWTLGERSAQ